MAAVQRHAKHIHDLPNLGLKSEAALAQIGMETVASFLAADPFELYAQLKQRHLQTSLNFLYAMIGAQQNVHWQAIKRHQRGDILMRLDEMGLAPK